MNHSHDFHDLREDSVDNAIASALHFPKVLAVVFRHHASGQWMIGEPLCGIEDSLDHQA